MDSIIISDLHLEFGERAPMLPEADILIFAGDLNTKARVQYLKTMSKYFEHVIFVDGNHEFYRGDLHKTRHKIGDELEPFKNVHYLVNEKITLDGVDFLGCTLWTDMDNGDPLLMVNASGMMNDFRKIRTNHYQGRFTPKVWLSEHEKSKNFLINNMTKNSVVITHHLPSMKSIDPKYKHMERMNHLYASDLEWMMTAYQPQLWIHGHTHCNMDYMVDNTRVVCNPRGYPGENPNFDPEFKVEIKNA